MEIVDTVKDSCMNVAATDETRAFFYKMIGDYYRYVAECAQADKLEAVKTGALSNYESAQKESNSLNACNPIRLGLALNFSVFYYEVMSDQAMACQIAKTAFDDAIADIEGIEEECYKDSTTIMQLIRDNLTLWTSEMGDDDDDEQQ